MVSIKLKSQSINLKTIWAIGKPWDVLVVEVDDRLTSSKDSG